MDEDRIGLFLDFENLAIGARDQLHGEFDFKPIADALAERGRVVVRRAYADWSMFGEAGRELTRHNVELIEIPQRMGMVRKNSADIKLAVDAIELSFERDYITTFVIGTGDSDFTPLVNKLRELNKRVIGLGVEASTSSMLPPACDEFLFYERLPGVDITAPRRGKHKADGRRKQEKKAATSDPAELDALVTQTLAGLKRRNGEAVLASSLKRTLLRKDPTFDEGAYGFRTFGELLQNLMERDVITIAEGGPGDPEVDFPRQAPETDAAFELLRDVVSEPGSHPLRGLKNEMRKREPGFSEKRYGYASFLQFCRAAEAKGFIEMEVDNENETYDVRPATPPKTSAAPAEEAAAGETDAAAESGDEAPEPKKKPTRGRAPAKRKPAKKTRK
jgi:uncharacterized protein (TIGR00288 family)